jgi:hypothetical protein
MRSEQPGRIEERGRFQQRRRVHLRGSARFLAVTVLSAAGLCAAATSATWAQSANDGADTTAAGNAVAANAAPAHGAQAAAGKTADKMAPQMASTKAGADNTLTAKEKADGWKLLFDGKTTDGWRVYKKQGAPVGWQAVDGVLTRVSQEGDLITADEYENFELTIDWKIPEGANSGLFFHGVESDKGPIYYSAPEYQLLDDDRHPDAKNGPTHQCGSNYDLIAPTKKLCKPIGEWNTSRIVVRGPHVEQWLNGEKVVEYELWSDAWKALVAKSKFKQWPDYGMAKTGHIGVQEHGFKVEFKNIKIKVLS